MKGFLSVFVCVLFAASIGCATKSAQKAAADMPDPHAGIFSQKCAKCHQIEKVEDAHATKSKVEMVEILKRMQTKPGSEITDSQLQMLIQQY
jgi:cytochrome c2